MTAPTKLNSGNARPVTTFEVLNAENPQVEREQLNRILKELSTRTGGTAGADGATGARGPAGADGADGVGVPAGGTTGQVLAKNSNTDYDTGWVTPGGVSDGDKGDITVTSSGATWTIDDGVVTTAKMGGDVTTAGKNLLDDADAAAQRTTLGLATIASSASASDLSSGTVATARLGSGVADASTYLRGDQTWASVTASVPALVSRIRVPPTFNHANLTATKTCTSNTTFAVYMGKADAAYSSVTVRLRVTTAAATITWAEVGIATGTPSPGGNPSLTLRGFTNTAAIVNSLGQKSITVNTTGIAAGDDIWVLVGAQATTALVIRAGLADDLQLGGQASRATTRPSTMASPETFTIEGATAACPWIGLAV